MTKCKGQLKSEKMEKIQKRDSATETHCDSATPLVCVSGMFWDEHWSNQQQIMSRLSMQRRVLYVERSVSLLSFFTGASDAPVSRQFWRWLRGGLRNESATLVILTPPPFLPLRFNRFVNRVNEWIRLRSIRRAMKGLNIQSPVLCIYEPDAGRIVGSLGELFSVYYCADDWAASDQWWNSAQDIRARETELASNVDLIVGTSTKLVKKWKPINQDTVLVSNGADVGSFKRALDLDLQVPGDLQQIPTPRIGYVGFVDGRFDTQLYERLADRRPGWHFVIIGPLMERHVDLSRLRQKPNVHFLGARPRASLPAYLKGFAVCTIPYICNTLAESIFPLKLFEYLAAGRPVVSTGLPELAAFSDYVRVAVTPDEFEEAIEMSISKPLSRVSEDFLAENSWDSKAECLWRMISRVPQ
jgi:glycosyltransferase involved in cell wall biosynthesis